MLASFATNWSWLFPFSRQISSVISYAAGFEMVTMQPQLFNLTLDSQISNQDFYHVTGHYITFEKSFSKFYFR